MFNVTIPKHDIGSTGTFISGFLNLCSAEHWCSAAPFLVFRGKIKKIKNILAQIKEIKNIFIFFNVIKKQTNKKF
jgi:hypothetical protein